MKRLALTTLALALCAACSNSDTASQDAPEHSPATDKPASHGQAPKTADVDALCADAIEGAVEIKSAWVRSAAEGRTITAAYFIACNKTAETRKITSVASPLTPIVEIHETTRSEDGAMKMRPVADIELPAGGMAHAKPGGLHVMLINLTAPIAAGESAPLTFTLDNDETITVTAAAKAPEAAAGHGAH